MDSENKIKFYERQAGEVIPDSPSSIKRLKLSESLPLDTPLAVHLFPVYACNLRCEFCIWALTEQERGYLSDVKVMPYDLYCRAIDGLARFPKKLGLWRIAGVGEPLMHPQIVDLVRYARQSGYVERVEIVTNGTFLTPEMSKGLIDAGLTRLRVSVEGNSSDTYLKYAKRSIDYDNLVKNIEYFYKNRGETKVYVKVMDYMLHSKAETEEFIARFEPISDALQIEHLTPVIHGIDFTSLCDSHSLNIRQTGGVYDDVEVCALPFYMLQLNPDGKIFPCCSFRVPEPLANINEKSLYDVWNSDTLRNFQLNMLDAGAAGMGGICEKCNYFKYIMQDSDSIDAARGVIRQKILSGCRPCKK